LHQRLAGALQPARPSGRARLVDDHRRQPRPFPSAPPGSRAHRHDSSGPRRWGPLCRSGPLDRPAAGPGPAPLRPAGGDRDAGLSRPLRRGDRPRSEGGRRDGQVPPQPRLGGTAPDMDPDDRLIEELGGELRRSLAEMRLHSEFREELKHRMLTTPPSRWRRWLGAWPPIARHRGALVGVAAAAIALAVVLPLAASQNNQAPRGRQYLVMIPPPASGGGSHPAEAAPGIPASCGAGAIQGAAAIQLTVTPAQATLRPGQSARFTVSETGVACPPAATITGPSAAGLSIAAVPEPPSSGNSASVKGSYEV